MNVRIDAAWLHWPETQTLIQAVAPLRFVGGCVRDALLERDVRDVDAATPLPPEQVMAQLKAAGLKAIPTGIDHGTVTALIGSRHFEITTLRRDVTTDGRHATVAYTDDWRQDAERRDFTMNALYCDAQGKVFDYFGGAQDAKAGHVCFIGDAVERIREDALRILRFFRFFAHYGQGPADRKGLKACAEQTALIDALSGERIQQEMLKLLSADSAGEVVELMQSHNIWQHVVPCNVTTNALQRLPEVLRKAHHKSNAILSLAALLRNPSDNALLSGITLIQNVADKWKLSNTHYKSLKALLAFPKGQGSSPASRQQREKVWKTRMRKEGKELFIQHIILALAEGMDDVQGLEAIALTREWDIPLFPVTGEDLIDRGAKPGRELGAELKRLEALWEESGYTHSKKELLALSHAP